MLILSASSSLFQEANEAGIRPELLFSVKDNGMTTLFGNHKITHAPGVSLPYCLICEPLSACFLHPEISVCLHGWPRPLRKASPTSTACQYLQGFHHGFPSDLPLPQRWVLRTSLECGLHEMFDKLALWAQEPPRQLRCVEGRGGVCVHSLKDEAGPPWHTLGLLLSSWHIHLMNCSQSHSERACLMGMVISTLF